MSEHSDVCPFCHETLGVRGDHACCLGGVRPVLQPSERRRATEEGKVLLCGGCGGWVSNGADHAGGCPPMGPETGDLPASGDVLGDRYLLHEPIGGGAIGGVFRGWDLQLERQVAVKVLRRSLVSSRDTIARFLTEARRVSAFDHDHIVPIYDVGRDARWLFFVMKLLEGCALERFIQAGKRFPEQEALAIMRQVAAGLAHVHAHGLVHRDVTAANVVLEDSGRVVLLDFGILRTLNASARKTAQGLAVGTPHYMAPEVLAGCPGDPRSDLYSAGVLLYELLAGASPFAAAGREWPAHVRPPVVPLRARLPHIDPDVDAIVARALQNDPTRRYESAEDLFRALRVIERRFSSEDTTRLRTIRRTAPSAPPTHGWSLRPVVAAALLSVALGALYVVGFGPDWDGSGAASVQPARALAASPPPQVRPVRERGVEAPRIAIDAGPVTTVGPEALARTERTGPRARRTALPAPARMDAVSEANGLAQSGLGPNAGAQAFRARGDTFARAGNLNAAIAAYRRYLALNPDAPDATQVQVRLASIMDALEER